MARLLTLLLLYKAGDEVGRYISLEQMMEQTKEGYYDTLYASSQGWHEMKHAILPWWECFLGVMLFGSYREFERRVGRHVGETELEADVEGKLHVRLAGDFIRIIVAEAADILNIDAGIVE